MKLIPWLLMVCLLISTGAYAHNGSVPVNRASLSLTSNDRHTSSGKTISEKDLDCLAYAMYREARGQKDEVLIGVGYLIKNRAHHQDFPSSFCGVTHQKTKVKVKKRHVTLCQFSWYCNASRASTPKEKERYQQIRHLALQVHLSLVKNPIGNHLYFHNATSKWLHWASSHPYHPGMRIPDSI